MISEVRPGVKQNLSETFSGSFGRRSTAADHWRSGPRRPAKAAPSPAATNRRDESMQWIASKNSGRNSRNLERGAERAGSLRSSSAKKIRPGR